MLGKMTWQQELDILTRFHENNLGPVTEEDKDDDAAGELQNKSVVDSVVDLKPLERVKGVGSGSKLSTQDDSFITKQIEDAFGTAHRDESVFSSKTSKSEADASVDKDSPQMTSTPKKSEVKGVSTKPKSIKRTSIKSEESGNCSQRSLGRGRGRKVHMPVEYPVGAVANMIEKNVGQGHRLDFSQAQQGTVQALGHNNRQLNNNNNSAYFPQFDYSQVAFGSRPGWWGSTAATERDTDKDKTRDKKKDLPQQEEKVKVERAVLSNWTPLDDSI